MCLSASLYNLPRLFFLVWRHYLLCTGHLNRVVGAPTDLWSIVYVCLTFYGKMGDANWIAVSGEGEVANWKGD